MAASETLSTYAITVSTRSHSWRPPPAPGPFPPACRSDEKVVRDMDLEERAPTAPNVWPPAAAFARFIDALVALASGDSGQSDGAAGCAPNGQRALDVRRSLNDQRSGELRRCDARRATTDKCLASAAAELQLRAISC